MKNKDANISIVDGFWKLLENLSVDMKKELVSRLNRAIDSESLKKKKPVRKRTWGEFIPEKTAEELCKELRDSRTFDRENESF